SSSSSSSDDGGGQRRRVAASGPFEGPSPSRLRRGVNDVWPEPFLEALAAQVAIDASLSIGRLAAAPALANVFRVCSTWQAVSRSDLLWQRLTRHVWGRTRLTRDTWNDEFIYRHRTARNFRTRSYSHFTLHFDPSDVDEPDGLTCRCLTLSDVYLAAGFADGTVRLFLLNDRIHVRTLRPPPRDRFGRFSRAVSGTVLSDADQSPRLTFATMDGDIHVAGLEGPDQQVRTAHVGDIVNDGALVDFAGCGRWWVGLFAGVPGRAFHIWDRETETTTFVGGSLTDPEAVMGWHTLTELTTLLGRIRISGEETAVASTRWRIMVIDLRNQGVILGDVEADHRGGLIVTSFDANREAYVSVDSRGRGNVRRVRTLGDICAFRVSGASRGRVVGCMNALNALMWTGGVVRVWEIEHGEYLYSFRERVGEVDVMVADDRHVAAATAGNTIHLWDFGAQ
ncbi:PREDICTED: transcriptional regulator STERILE APETALA, partial [Tarenaya hassleriana]|uniref:transcriptional regulator STERILE APETALA n=1 Tax=Tarenaya hassleriana TaxID=28532 RepID=UPI00053C8E0D